MRALLVVVFCLASLSCTRPAPPPAPSPAAPPAVDPPAAAAAAHDPAPTAVRSASSGSGATVEVDAAAAPLPCPPPEVRGVILMIGDGMGPAQAEAARQYSGADLAFDHAPHRGLVATASADNPITDSAAAATAMATGVRVNNGVVSVALPGTGAPLTTVLETAQRCGRAVGLVTTAQASHATPAAFSAHVAERGMYPLIAEQQLRTTRPNVIFGGGGPGLTPEDAAMAGYTVVLDATQLAALDPASAGPHVAGLFAVGHVPYVREAVDGVPRLPEMTTRSLALLERDPDGFFLMVEGGRIDHAAHDHHIEDTVLETLEFSQTVDAVLRWAGERDDVAILVTADHETGGLSIVTPGAPGRLPEVTWSTTMHTGVDVGYWAWGPGASGLPARLLNTDVALWASGRSPVGAP